MAELDAQALAQLFHSAIKLQAIVALQPPGALRVSEKLAELHCR